MFLRNPEVGLLVNFACFLSFAYFFFLKSTFFEKFFQEYHQNVTQFGSRSGPTKRRTSSGSNQFGSRSGPTTCRTDLGPNCLQR